MSSLLRARARAARWRRAARPGGFVGHPPPLPRLGEMGGTRSRFYRPVPAGRRTAIRYPSRSRGPSPSARIDLLGWLNRLLRRAG